MTRRFVALEAIAVAGILTMGVLTGSFASRHFSGQPSFYQGEFGPAVMIAAGRGFVTPVEVPGSPLDNFLARRSPAISVGDLAGVKVQKPDQFQEATRYLMYAIGYGWRISGISWSAVSRVAALLYGLSILACYAICRVWLSRTLAALGALFICFSPWHLQQLPHIRDYSKEPFILFAILLTTVVALLPLARWTIVGLSAACGVVIGLGIGFKMDALAMAPIFVTSVFAFRDRWPWTGLLDKALSAGVFAAALLMTAWPMFSHLSAGGSNGFHAILLGYSDPFERELGIERSVYSFLPFYDDSYVTSAVKSYGARLTGQFPPAPSPAFDAAGRAYWLEIVRHFPADIVTRAVASANGILNLPFNEPALNLLTPPAGGDSPLWTILTNQVPHRARVGAVYEWLTLLNGWGAVFGVVLVAAGSVRSLRRGLFAAWIILALGAYSSLQFAGRHVFHLEIIPVLGVLVALSLLSPRRWPGRQVALRCAVTTLTLVLTAGAVVALLRAYQTAHLRRLFQSYVDSPRQAMQPAFSDLGDGAWRVKWNAPADPASANLRLKTDYYVVEFDGPAKSETSAVGFHYQTTPPAPDYSRVVSIREEAGVNRVFIPVYSEPPVITFDGIELPSGIKNRLRGIYHVTYPDRLPLLLELRLSGTWRQEGLNQTLRVGDMRATDDIQVLGGSTGTTGSLVALLGRAELADAKLDPLSVELTYTKAARVTPDSVAMDGAADTQSSYLVQFKPTQVNAPAALLVRGRLDAGGLAFGLLKEGRWYRQLATSTHGEFIGVINITESGIYTPIITNATIRDRDRNRFVLSRFNIVATNPARQ